MKWFTYSAFVALLLILAFSPFIEIPYQLQTVAKLIPQKQWFLIKGPDGELYSSLMNNGTNQIEAYNVWQVDRGEQTSYMFRSFATSEIGVGDTVCTLIPGKLVRDISDASNKRSVARARLNMISQGDKPQRIALAEHNLKLVLAEQEEQRMKAEKTKALFKEKLISELEYRLVLLKERQITERVNIANAELSVAQSGAKPAQIRMVENEVKLLDEQLFNLQKQQQQNIITSPIAGHYKPYFSGDTLFTVNDDAFYYAHFPLQLTDIPLFPGEIEVVLNTTPNPEKMVVKIEPVITKQIQNRPVYFYRFITEKRNFAFSENMVIPLRIKGNNITLWNYLSRKIN